MLRDGLEHKLRAQPEIKPGRHLVVLWLKIAKSGSLRAHPDEKWQPQYKMLLDSGSSSSIISTRLATLGVSVDQGTPVRWSTVQGSFSTQNRVKLKFSLPAFSSNKNIHYTFHVAKKHTSLGYDVIAGIDFLTALGVQLDFKARMITWDDITVEMQDSTPAKKVGSQKLFLVQEPKRAHEATKRMIRITDAQYEPGSVDTLCEKQSHLMPVEKRELLTLLQGFPEIFDGKLGAMIGPPVSIQIKKGEEPVNLRPYPVPVKRKAVFLKETKGFVISLHATKEKSSPSQVSVSNNLYKHLYSFVCFN